MDNKVELGLLIAILLVVVLDLGINIERSKSARTSRSGTGAVLKEGMKAYVKDDDWARSVISTVKPRDTFADLI